MVCAEYVSYFTYSGNGLARVLSFTDRHTNQFSAEIGKDSSNHRTPQSVEAACVTRALVFLEGTLCKYRCQHLFAVLKICTYRILPISKALSVTIRTASEREDERKNDHAANYEYFDR